MTPSQKSRIALPVLAIVGVVALGSWFSLAGDLGHDPAEVEKACVTDGGCRRLVQALETRAFPHATNAPVEAYVLASGNGTVRQVLVIDWQAVDARILDVVPDGVAPAATLTLTEKDYAYLVSVLRRIQAGEDVPDSWAQGLSILLTSGMDVQGRNLVGDVDYKRELAWWAVNARA